MMTTWFFSFWREKLLFFFFLLCLFVFSKNTTRICSAHPSSMAMSSQRKLTLEVIFSWNSSGFRYLCWIITSLREKQNCCGLQYMPAHIFTSNGECMIAQTTCIRPTLSHFIEDYSPYFSFLLTQRKSPRLHKFVVKVNFVNLGSESVAVLAKERATLAWLKKTPQKKPFSLPCSFE